MIRLFLSYLFSPRPVTYPEVYFNYLAQALTSLIRHPRNWRHHLLRAKLHLSQLKVARTPRYTSTFIELSGIRFELVDSWSFLWTYEDIFEQQIYRFVSKCKHPTIIDGGANIGLSILYLKQLFPESRIIAFEPDEKIFGVLQRNIRNFGLGQVELVNKALWSSETILEFLSDGADAGRLTPERPEGNKHPIPTVRLRDYLNTRIEFLKLDIEGAETEVLRDCSDVFANVQNLFVEYHSFVNKSQDLNVILNILSQAGFRLHVHTPFKSPQPLFHRNVNFGMDLLLNIFAFRE